MTDPKTHERRRHYRGVSRPGLRIQCQFRVAGSDNELEEALTRNIGPGGAFIACPVQPDVGAQLELHMKLPGSLRTVVIFGEVRWFLEGDKATRGVGLRFIDLSADARLALSEYFASLFGAQAP
jgi:hypothetical protein